MNSVVSFKLSQNVKEPEKGCSGYGRSDFRERRTSFSLDFREIRPSEFVGTRRNVVLRDEA